MEERFEAIENRQECLETELAGLSRVIANMEKTIAGHDEVLKKNGIGELRVCVGELKTLVYGDDKVGAPGLVSQIKAEQSKMQELIRQRDALKFILFGVGIASLGQLGLVGAIATKVFGGP